MMVTAATDTEKMIQENKGLVYKVVQDIKKKLPNLHHSHGFTTEDLIQIGFIGLILAVRGFKQNSGVKFSTYAVPKIRFTILREISRNHLIKIPRTIAEYLSKIVTEYDNGKTPKEIANKYNLKHDDVQAALKLDLFVKSINDEVKTEESKHNKRKITFEDVLGITYNFEDGIANNEILKKFYLRINDRDLDIFFMYYNEGKTQKEIAEKYGITQVQVSRILKNVIRKAEKFGKECGLRN